MPSHGSMANRRSFTAVFMISDMTRWTLTTVAGDRRAASPLSHACTAECSTSANRTLRQRGRTCSRTMPE
jgi:hypothetical protein